MDVASDAAIGINNAAAAVLLIISLDNIATVTSTRMITIKGIPARKPSCVAIQSSNPVVINALASAKPPPIRLSLPKVFQPQYSDPGSFHYYFLYHCYHPILQFHFLFRTF